MKKTSIKKKLVALLKALELKGIDELLKQPPETFKWIGEEITKTAKIGALVNLSKDDPGKFKKIFPTVKNPCDCEELRIKHQETHQNEILDFKEGLKKKVPDADYKHLTGDESAT